MQALKEKLAAKKEEEGSQGPAISYRRLLDLNRAEWRFGALGVVTAAISGLQVGWRAVLVWPRQRTVCSTIQATCAEQRLWGHACELQMPGFSLALGEALDGLYLGSPAAIK